MTKLRRIAFFAGLGAPALMFVAGFFGNAGGGAPTPFLARSNDLGPYYLQNAHTTVVEAVLNLLGVVLVSIFAAGLWERFCDFDPSTTRGWAILGLIGTGLFCSVTTAVALVEMSLAGLALVDPDSDAIRALAVLLNTGIHVAAFAAVPMLFGFGMAGLAAPAYARWLAWLALVGAGAGVLGILPDAVAPVSVGAADLLGLLGQLTMPALFFWLFGSAFGVRKTLVHVHEEETQGV